MKEILLRRATYRLGSEMIGYKGGPIEFKTTEDISG